MNEILPKKCDRCGTHLIVKIRAAAKRPVLEWYWWCSHCKTREVFKEEPIEDD